MSLSDTFRKLPERVRAQIADQLITRYCDPAFGALPKREIDLLFFGALVDAGLVGPKTTQYDTARLLRVTPARIRSLAFQAGLRDPHATADTLRRRLAEALTTVQYAKEEMLVVFGIEDPLLQADLVARLKALEVTPDFSFNRELVRIPKSMFGDLLDALLDEQKKQQVVKGLVRAGFPDGSFREVVKGALGKLAEKVADEAGKQAAKEIVDAASPAIRSLLGQGVEAVGRAWKTFGGGKGGGPGATDTALA
ncbi:hypothetical protein [Limobrevibacterium gyesilva]|uniref:Uncharacterized protein n=1 Tax=Limobrevibacterium gyesilva TaxID=2991712 RepID=A0AA41YTR6_9PROT|nr:hypothetical protein [Limobrevibacterium gyesilva]MCW3476408.1 hypothetical protein [Limobrevibacterium gyesilva]